MAATGVSHALDDRPAARSQRNEASGRLGQHARLFQHLDAARGAQVTAASRGRHVRHCARRMSAMPWEDARERMRYHRGASATTPRPDFVFASPLRPAARRLRRLRAAQLHGRTAAGRSRARPDVAHLRRLRIRDASHRREHAGPRSAAPAARRLPGLRARHARVPAQPGAAGALRERLSADRTAAGPDRARSAATHRTPGSRCTCPAQAKGQARGSTSTRPIDRSAGEDYVSWRSGRDYSDVSPIRGVIHGGAQPQLLSRDVAGRRSKRSYNRGLNRNRSNA